ncbi:hypothetical protein V7094_29155 [Priestia megaterium]|uniref:hypothetical protein n=1 Tax=Priestia megaterium TaxID=1404 RepID=UPI002FFFC507
MASAKFRIRKEYQQEMYERYSFLYNCSSEFWMVRNEGDTATMIDTDDGIEFRINKKYIELV